MKTKMLLKILLVIVVACPMAYSADGVAYGLEGSNLYRIDSSGAAQIAGEWSGLQGLVGLGNGTAMGYKTIDATHDKLYYFSAAGSYELDGEYNVMNDLDGNPGMVGSGDGTVHILHGGYYVPNATLLSIDPVTDTVTGTAGSWALKNWQGSAGNGCLAGDGSAYGQEGNYLYYWNGGDRTNVAGAWVFSHFATAGDGAAYGVEGSAVRYFNADLYPETPITLSYACSGLVGAGNGAAYVLQNTGSYSLMAYVTRFGAEAVAGGWDFSMLEGAGNGSAYGLEGSALNFFDGSTRSLVPGTWDLSVLVGAGDGDAFGVEAGVLKYFSGSAYPETIAGTWNFDSLVGAGAVPEPATLVLLSIGGLLLRRRS